MYEINSFDAYSTEFLLAALFEQTPGVKAWMKFDRGYIKLEDLNGGGKIPIAHKCTLPTNGAPPQAEPAKKPEVKQSVPPPPTVLEWPGLKPPPPRGTEQMNAYLSWRTTEPCALNNRSVTDEGEIDVNPEEHAGLWELYADTQDYVTGTVRGKSWKQVGVPLRNVSESAK